MNKICNIVLFIRIILSNHCGQPVVAPRKTKDGVHQATIFVEPVSSPVRHEIIIFFPNEDFPCALSSEAFGKKLRREKEWIYEKSVSLCWH